MSVTDLISPAVGNHVISLLQDLRISDYSMDISPGSIKGDNFLGVIANVVVKGKDENHENVTLDLIVKSAPISGNIRVHVPIRIPYEREIFMYSRVLSEYSKLQQEKCINHPFKSFPKFYSSTMGDFSEAIVMENMKTHGYKLLDRYEPFNYDHALIIIRNYGKLHALSFAVKDQKPVLFKEFSANTQETWKVEGQSELELSYRQIKIEKAISMFEPEEEVCKQLKHFQQDMMGKVHASLKSEEAGEYAAIGHGDGWINNFLFLYEDAQNPTAPTEVCFLDWQLSRLGSPALDLGYFIFTCTDKDLRDEHYEDLINEYYNSFSSFLRELGSDPEKLFPYKVLQEHLKRFSVYGLFMAVMILYFISSDNDELPDVNKIQDIEDAKKQFSYVSKNIDKYRSRIRGVVLDFVKYDYYF